MDTKVFLIWEQNYEDDGETYKSVFKVTLDEDVAKQYCDDENKKQLKLFNGRNSIYRTRYFYSTEVLTESFIPEL